MLEGVTGSDVTVAELRTVAGRIVTGRKCLNIREGWTRTENTIPARHFTVSASTSRRPPLTRTRLEAQVAACYRERGWTDDGNVPAPLGAA
jgi:aldehyde:ferredoxin oxidoreductase